MAARFLLTVAALLSTVASAAGQSPPLRLELNIPTLRVVVYEGDRVLKSYPVAVGKIGHDTPEGEFSISHAEWNPWWRPPQGREWTRGKEITPPGPTNPMGRVKLFFEPLYFIHGTPEAESIGSPASHGCIRMKNADVIDLARLLHERADAGVSGSAIDKILAQPKTTRHVRFGQAVPFVIRYAPVVVVNGEMHVYPDVYRRNAVHSESVYQALLAAGYEVHGVDRRAVADLLERAKRSKGTLRVRVDEVFGKGVAVTRR
jgi:murein L,D-transpeptidase YcbB/YkuD